MVELREDALAPLDHVEGVLVVDEVDMLVCDTFVLVLLEAQKRVYKALKMTINSLQEKKKSNSHYLRRLSLIHI